MCILDKDGDFTQQFMPVMRFAAMTSHATASRTPGRHLLALVRYLTYMDYAEKKLYVHYEDRDFLQRLNVCMYNKACGDGIDGKYTHCKWAREDVCSVLFCECRARHTC